MISQRSLTDEKHMVVCRIDEQPALTETLPVGMASDHISALKVANGFALWYQIL